MVQAPHPDPRRRPTLANVAGVFLRHANFTLGGGSATSAVLRGQLLDKRGWIDADTFTVCFALGRLTPGTNVLAFCTGIGWQIRGAAGALVALLAASVPCTAMVVAATALFSIWQKNPWAQAALSGAIAAAVAVTVKTCWTIAHPYVRKGTRLRVAMTASAAFVLNVALRLPPIEVLLLAGLVGFLMPVTR